MARPPRQIIADDCYHGLNRGKGRMTLFHKHEDFVAFLNVLREGLEHYPVDLLCYCLMSNHWHLVLRPRKPAALANLMQWVGVTHVRRRHEHYHSRGGGHLYQGRFKSFPIQDDRQFPTLCRYVEANPLRAEMMNRAEGWRYSSLRWWPGIELDVPAEESPVPLREWPSSRPDLIDFKPFDEHVKGLIDCGDESCAFQRKVQYDDFDHFAFLGEIRRKPFLIQRL